MITVYIRISARGAYLIFGFLAGGGGGKSLRGALIRGRLIQFLDCRGSLIRERRLFERGR